MSHHAVASMCLRMIGVGQERANLDSGSTCIKGKNGCLVPFMSGKCDDIYVLDV